MYSQSFIAAALMAIARVANDQVVIHPTQQAPLYVQSTTPVFRQAASGAQSVIDIDVNVYVKIYPQAFFNISAGGPCHRDYNVTQTCTRDVPCTRPPVPPEFTVTVKECVCDESTMVTAIEPCATATMTSGPMMPGGGAGNGDNGGNGGAEGNGENSNSGTEAGNGGAGGAGVNGGKNFSSASSDNGGAGCRGRAGGNNNNSGSWARNGGAGGPGGEGGNNKSCTSADNAGAGCSSDGGNNNAMPSSGNGGRGGAGGQSGNNNSGTGSGNDGAGGAGVARDSNNGASGAASAAGSRNNGAASTSGSGHQTTRSVPVFTGNMAALGVSGGLMLLVASVMFVL